MQSLLSLCFSRLFWHLSACCASLCVLAVIDASAAPSSVICFNTSVCPSAVDFFDRALFGFSWWRFVDSFTSSVLTVKQVQRCLPFSTLKNISTIPSSIDMWYYRRKLLNFFPRIACFLRRSGEA